MNETNPAQVNEARPRQFSWSWEQIKSLFMNTYREWSAVEAPRMGASLAFYTMLSLAPMLIVVIAVAGWVFGEQASRGALVAQIQGLVGPEGAQAIQGIIQHAASQKTTGTFAAIVGFVALLFGASSVALELRSALDKIWNVKEPEGLAGFIKARSYALAVVLGAGFVLLASLVISAALASLDKFFSQLMPIPVWVAEGVNAIVSLLVIAAVLAAIFKLLPNAPITWRDVAVGAVFTAVLFTIGKTLIGIYLGRASVGSSYGAAGSLVVVLVWIYYSAQIVFFGAEFTRIYANEYGSNPDSKLESSPSPAHDVTPQREPAVAAFAGAAASGNAGLQSGRRSLAANVATLIGSAAGLTAAAVKLFEAGNGSRHNTK
jgi:membrane protein